MTTHAAGNTAPATRNRQPGATIGAIITRLLEGAHPWGTIRIGTPDRWGWQQFRLAMYPPGTNSAERRALNFNRNWPLLGSLLCFMVMIALGAAISPAVAGAIAAALWLAGIALGAATTRKTRSATRYVSALIVPKDGKRAVIGELDAIVDAHDDLTQLDQQHTAGLIDEVGYEAGWAAVYRRLATAQRPARQWNL